MMDDELSIAAKREKDKKSQEPSDRVSVTFGASCRSMDGLRERERDAHLSFSVYSSIRIGSPPCSITIAHISLPS